MKVRWTFRKLKWGIIMKKNGLIALFLVIIILIVITFLILFDYFIGFSADSRIIKDGKTNIYIVDTSKDDKKDNKNDNQSSNIIQNIKNFFTGNNGSNNDNKNDENKEEEYIEPFDVYIEPVVSTDGHVGFLQVDSDKIWDSENTLNIFKNPKRGGKNILYPGVYNAYHFQIQNKTDYTFYYKLSFTESNQENINILYRIRKNEKYVNKNWKRINELLLEEGNLESTNLDDYIIEWKWFDGSNDTEIGINSQNVYYSLDLRIVGYSEQMEEEEEK